MFSLHTKSGNNFYLLMLLSICVVSLALVQFNRYPECALLLILDLTQVGGLADYILNGPFQFAIRRAIENSSERLVI